MTAIGEEEVDWVAMGHTFGSFCIRALLLALEAGAERLPVDPAAWDNTLAAVEWTLMQHVLGRAGSIASVTVEDVRQARRLRALGADALAGGPRSPKLGPLAEHCLVLLSGPEWRRGLERYPSGFEVYPPL